MDELCNILETVWNKINKIVGYLMPNFLYAFIKYIGFVNKWFVL